MKTTSDAVKILDNMFRDDPEFACLAAEEQVKGQVAREIYHARNAAGLSQEALAALICVEPSVIDSLEEADYEGDTLGLLSRIAQVLEQRVEIRFVPANVIEPLAA